MIKFKVPLQSEVAAYMREKKRWPDGFCKYYAERFWNYYNSNGWKVGNKAAMKSWQSAFISQWQNVKHAEDQQELQKWSKNGTSQPPPEKMDAYGRLNLRMEQSTKDDASIPDNVYVSIYDFLAPKGLLLLVSEQVAIIEDLIQIYSDEEERVKREKILAVKFTFINMKGKGKRFYAPQPVR